MKKIILLFVVGMFLISGVFAETSFTPIFCNDYEFTGCYAEETTTTQSITDESSWICPEDSYSCYIESVSDDKDWYVGNGNCHIDTEYMDEWVCDYQNSNVREMDPGDQVYLKGSWGISEANVYVTITYAKLKFSGTACGAGGTPVSGADGCTFTPNGNILYESDSDIENKIETTSYTVPLTTPSPTCIMSWVSGNRHICGYKEESCSSDSDCSGHTYGNQECSGRTLETYGCVEYGSELNNLEEISGGLLNLDGDTAGITEDVSQTESNTFGQRCEITKSQQVQCCGDTDCGSGMFCDTATFTCQEEIECEEDSDCGVSVQCDWTTNILKTPVCKSGKCGYEEEEVGCCLDKNCEEGYFCNEHKECEISSRTNQENANSSDLSSQSSSSLQSSSSTGIIILIIFLILIGGSIGFFIYTKNKNKKLKHKVKKDFKEHSKKCKKCGHSLKQNSKFCTKCGRRV